MFIKNFMVTPLATLALSSSMVNADSSHDATFTDGVLTVSRVIAAGSLYENVQMKLDFDANTFALLNAQPHSRFSSEIIDMDEVLTDHIAQHSWVNGTHGCHINANVAATATGDIVEFCEALEFAGFSDWRAPTSMEMSEMIIHADHMDVQLNYINPACQFMATSGGFVQTENTSVPDKIVETAVNSGSRCVR
ncbi:MAG: hypothetical protein H0A75_03345 [Candidatus Methanofishera endochildressiae]|uniref:DUF1566 domain-containing protein n=1 Tax=Candidatus Methanofishera endochildressiae TaxID=2738884 RepID=A0A7Z0MNS8_9GAMM|nr:hypothetical protein [Candidatus Methanofishera endochildressiae]